MKLFKPSTLRILLPVNYMQFYPNNMQSMKYAVKNMTRILMSNYHSSMFIIYVVPIFTRAIGIHHV